MVRNQVQGCKKLSRWSIKSKWSFFKVPPKWLSKWVTGSSVTEIILWTNSKNLYFPGNAPYSLLLLASASHSDDVKMFDVAYLWCCLLPEEKTLQAGEEGGRLEAEEGRETHEETRWGKTSPLQTTLLLLLAATVTRLINTHWRWKEILCRLVPVVGTPGRTNTAMS